MFDMFPAPVTPWGKSTTYEKPKKRHAVLNFKDRFKLKLDAESDYAQKLRGEITSIERRRLIQAEALAKLGEGHEKALDVELMKTDDIESDDADVFSRVEKFKELQKRIKSH